MQLITEEYRKLNAEKHLTSSQYGTVGHYYSDEILRLSNKLKTKDILDYGCGKSTLSNALPFSINQYDPCIRKHADDPSPADLVVCTDVMEHIEHELLDNVLKHIHSKTKKLFYCAVNTKKANKHLSDGRNAHLIIEDLPFWAERLGKYFLVLSVNRMNNDLIIVSEPKDFNDE